jgi:hypothetical protein
MTSQLQLPPTGPDSTPFSHEDGAPEKYIAWRETYEGQSALSLMGQIALQDVAAGARRVSINYLSDRLRARSHIRHCNTWRPWMADDLIHRHPVLADFIQRKVRSTTGPVDA